MVLDKNVLLLAFSFAGFLKIWIEIRATFGWRVANFVHEGVSIDPDLQVH